MLNRVATLLFLAILGSLLGLSTAQAKIRFIVSVDWEGEDLRAENIQSMKDFRKLYPGLPIHHFLNPAYFLNHPQAWALHQIQSTLLPGDEIGLHLHARQTIVEAAKVTFRNSPNFRGAPSDQPAEAPLSAYTMSEQKKLFGFSLGLLKDAGFRNVTSFRAGGWMASPEGLEALTSVGIEVDSSELNADYLGSNTLSNYVRSLWPDTSKLAQPHFITTRAGTILEVPDNSALADWISEEAMKENWRTLVELAKKNPEKDFYFQIGFHQETAAAYLFKIKNVIQYVRNDVTNRKIPFEVMEKSFVEAVKVAPESTCELSFEK